MKKTLEITEMHDNEGVEDGNDKVTELPTNSFLYREQEQKKKLVELKQKDTEQTQNIIRKLSTRFKRNSWLAIGGAIDPGTGNLQTPPDGIGKNFKRQFKKKVNKWCFKGEGNPAVKAFYYMLFTALVLFYGLARVEEASYKYYLSNAISERILSDENNPFLDVHNVDTFWSYLHGPLASITKKCSNTTNPECYASISDSVILTDDFVFMQLRRQPTLRKFYTDATGKSNCYVPPILNKRLDKEINSCYLDFILTKPDLNLWANKTIIPENIESCFLLYEFGHDGQAKSKVRRQSVFTMDTAPVVNTRYNTWFHLDYGSKGYRICTFDFLGESLKQGLKSLEQYEYIDRGTTIVFVDFTVYSMDLQAIAHVQLIFEFIPSGDIYPTYKIDVFSVSGLTKSGTTSSFGILIFVEIAVSIQILALLMNSYGVGRHSPKDFFCDFNFIYNALCIIMYLFVFAFEHYLIGLRQQIITRENTIERNMNIMDIAFYESFMTGALSIAVLMTVFRVLQYLKLSKRLSLIVLTIERAFEESWFTLFTVILVVISYALAFYIELGGSMKQFRNFRTSFITCLASLFVEIDLIEEIFIHSRYLGPALLITYMFFVSFVVLSLFLAIIEGAFEAIKKEAEEETVDPLLAAFRQEAAKQKRHVAALKSFPRALTKLNTVTSLTSHANLNSTASKKVLQEDKKKKTTDR